MDFVVQDLRSGLAGWVWLGISLAVAAEMSANTGTSTSKMVVVLVDDWRPQFFPISDSPWLLEQPQDIVADFPQTEKSSIEMPKLQCFYALASDHTTIFHSHLLVIRSAPFNTGGNFKGAWISGGYDRWWLRWRLVFTKIKIFEVRKKPS